MRAPSNGDAFMCVRIDPPKQEELVCLSPANGSDLSLSLLVGTYKSAVHSFGVVMRVTAFLSDANDVARQGPSFSRSEGLLQGPPVLRAMRESTWPQRQLEPAVRKM